MYFFLTVIICIDLLGIKAGRRQQIFQKNNEMGDEIKWKSWVG